MNSVLPRNVIISKKPKEYLKQGFSHCGMYSVKAVLSAYGKDVKGNPKDYHHSWIGRLTGSTFGLQPIVTILHNYGVAAKAKHAHSLSSREKLHVLKVALAKGRPVMVRIGNGYLPSGRYNSILGKLVGHWITIWGFNEDERIFYMYDSCVPKERYESIPIGNVKRSYDELLRDWSGTVWDIFYGSYTYIEIMSMQ